MEQDVLWVTPLVGWRVWSLEMTYAGKIRLTSSYAWYGKWPINTPFRAKCLITWHAAPHIECTCGIYAAKDLKQIKKILSWDILRVLGQVSLWGRVVEGKKGYRAEFAYPRNLWVPPGISVYYIYHPKRGCSVPVSGERILQDLSEYGVEAYIGEPSESRTAVRD